MITLRPHRLGITLAYLTLAAIALNASTGCVSHAKQSGVTNQAPSQQLGFHTLSVDDFEDLKASVLFTEEDARYLRMSRSVLEPNIDELLDVWYGFVGANEHLLYYFTNPRTGEPDMDYLSKVRIRFAQWVIDTADADYNEVWLQRQLEIGLRHHRLKKNKTDGADSVPVIHFRHLVALHYPITATIRPFLERGDHSETEVQKMHEAWRKAVLMTVILWSQPYVDPQDY